MIDDLSQIPIEDVFPSIEQRSGLEAFVSNSSSYVESVEDEMIASTNKLKAVTDIFISAYHELETIRETVLSKYETAVAEFRERLQHDSTEFSEQLQKLKEEKRKASVGEEALADTFTPPMVWDLSETIGDNGEYEEETILIEPGWNNNMNNDEEEEEEKTTRRRRRRNRRNNNNNNNNGEEKEGTDGIEIY